MAKQKASTSVFSGIDLSGTYDKNGVVPTNVPEQPKRENISIDVMKEAVKEVIKEQKVEPKVTTYISEKTFKRLPEKEPETRLTVRMEAGYIEAVGILAALDKRSKNTIVCMAIQEYISKPENRKRIENVINGSK